MTSAATSQATILASASGILMACCHPRRRRRALRPDSRPNKPAPPSATASGGNARAALLTSACSKPMLIPSSIGTTRWSTKPLVYDSHEYFTQVPELIHRPKVQKLWHRLEKHLLPKVTSAYTVCHSIADVYFKEYGVPIVL